MGSGYDWHSFQILRGDPTKPIIIISIVAVVLICIFAVVLSVGAIGIGLGNKVTVTGNVNYNMVTGWSASYEDCVVEEDGILAVLWYMPWETKDIEVSVELIGNGTYQAIHWVDKINLVGGSSSFSIEIRHVPSGSYAGRITVYEVEKGLLWGEVNRILQTETNFEVKI